MRFTGLLFSLMFSIAAWEFCASVAHPSLPHVVHYEVVQLQPLKGRVKRSASSQQKYPDTAEYALSVDGNNFTLSLEKNRELLGTDYALTYYTKDGIKVMKPPSNKDLCYYQGHIQDVQNSSVSVGLCSGMRGFLRAGDRVYLIEPLEASVRGDHAVYKQEHLRTKRAVFDYVNDTVYDIGPRFAGLYNGRNSKNKAFAAAQRFVEMVLVVDNSEYKKIGNLKSVEKRMLEVANHVDKLYRPLNIRVMLVGLEVWSHTDQFEVSPVPKVTLDRFSQWRQNSLLTRKKHDNAQFVTATDFDGSTVGLAPLYAMCSPNSGAVNEDHSKNPIGVASTIAHEMGHNLGMSHDDASCVCPSGSSQGCVMGESIGMVYPEAFSTCSKMALEMFLQNYDSNCLLNVPNEEDLFGGPVCGNAFLEKGEECDCGTVEECKNPCCNATTCRLTEGSKCAHGECCQNCQLKHAGSPCRASAHDCDLEEYCTGVSAQCPKDDYKMNGLPCDYNRGYCYNGQCPSLKEHCKKLWGPDADVDTDTCFDNNRYDRNCPKDRSGRCPQVHTKCGIIYCSGGNEFPVTRQKFKISTHMKDCYSAIEASSADSIGMVATGTKCGTNKVCYDSLCQDISVYGTENCSAKCNNHGVCNHEKQCHCDPGWAPPHCDVKLSDVLNHKEAVIIGVTTTIAILLLLTLAIGASVCCKKQKTPFLKKRPLKDTSTYSGQSNPVFQSNSAKNSPRCGPPRISQPTFLESTANQSCKPLFPTAAPTRPAPQPPKVVAEPRMEQNVKPSFPSPVVPVYANQTKPLLPPSKPLPPSRPLPPLTFKPEFKPKSPPLPPVKPPGTQPAWNPSQVRTPPKVALKPPTKFV